MKTTRPVVWWVIIAVVLVFQTTPVAAESPDRETYEPYADEEFPQWLRDIRRAEIVYIGSFPITLLVATLVYDGFRAIRDAIAVSRGTIAFSERAEFGGFSNVERRWLLVSGLSLSGIVAIADILIEIEQRRPEPARTE